MRVVAPIGAVERDSVPLDARPAKQLIEAECALLLNHITALPKFIERFDESMNVFMPL
jgi:hypothetical protein